MLTKKLFLAIAFLLFSTIALQSCQDDDNDAPPELEPIVFPHTVSFSHIENSEFNMWTINGVVNTDNLSIEDYFDGYLLSTLSPNDYDLANGYTFEEDSLIFPGNSLGVQKVPYLAQNDSIFIIYQTLVDGDTIPFYNFYAFGNQLEMRIQRGALRFNKNNSSGEDFNWSGRVYFTPEYILNQGAHDEALPENLELGDTLTIYNNTLVFN